MTYRPFASLSVAAVVAAVTAQSAATTAGAQAPPRLTVCHATHSTISPYRRILLPAQAVSRPKSRAGRLLRVHLRHPGDLVVVGAARCPGENAVLRLTASLRPRGGGTGSGTASFKIRLGRRELCYSLSVSGLADVTAAHVHRASSGAAVISLWTVTSPGGATSSVCDTYGRSLLRELVTTPSAFYVDVHTRSFPAGQLRGTLAR